MSFKYILTLLLVATCAWAPGFITGLAFDSVTGTPVAGVQIYCRGDTREGPKVLRARTNALGRYRLPFVLRHHEPVFKTFKFGYRDIIWQHPERWLVAGDTIDIRMVKKTLNHRNLAWQLPLIETNLENGSTTTQPQMSSAKL